ncbi:MAG: PEGA domain-containing protein [Ignavibacteriales bacterium]|nr:PEGA domain-containing protein [Ignavibacteriales bacterium]
MKYFILVMHQRRICLWQTLFFVFFLACAFAQDESWLTVKINSGVANVFVDSVFIGTTPLDSVSMKAGTHVLRFVRPDERSWYHVPVVETVSVSAGEHLQRNVEFPQTMFNPNAMLIHSTERMSNDSGTTIPTHALENGLPPNNLPMYLTASGAVLSGAVAAYFKLKADNLYKDYDRTGDQSVLDKVKTYDTISGIALGVCEINLGLLTYILLSK